MRIKAYLHDVETGAYKFSHNLEVNNAPHSADWTRSAMVYDNLDFRLYCFKEGSNDTLYQFAFSEAMYEFGHNGHKEIKITGVPVSANTDQFAMLHDGKNYRLYIGDIYEPKKLHQFIWNGNTYCYLPEAEAFIDKRETSNTNCIAMLHTKKNLELYALDKQNGQLSQSLYNITNHTFKKGNAYPIKDIPDYFSVESFSVMQSKNACWLYLIDGNNQQDFLSIDEELHHYSC